MTRWLLLITIFLQEWAQVIHGKAIKIKSVASLTVTADPGYLQCHLDFEDNGSGTAEYILNPVDGTELTSAMMSPSEGIIKKLMTRIMMKPMMKKAFKAGADKMDAYLQAS